MNLRRQWIHKSIAGSDARTGARGVTHRPEGPEYRLSVRPDNYTAGIQKRSVDQWVSKIRRCTRVRRTKLRAIKNGHPCRYGEAGRERRSVKIEVHSVLISKQR